MANKVDKIEISVKKWQGTTDRGTELVEVKGEVLEALLKIDENPTDAILKAIKVAIELRAYGPRFKVQKQQAPPGTFDVFEWKPK